MNEQSKRQYVGGDEGAEIFSRLRSVVVERGMFDGLTVSDERYLRDALGALLVTKPIDANEPFVVSRPTDVGVDVEGCDFEVRFVRVTPLREAYDLEFVALDPASKYEYTFKGRVGHLEPNVMVETALLAPVAGGDFSAFV